MKKNNLYLALLTSCAIIGSCQERNQKENSLVKSSNKQDLLQSHIDTTLTPDMDFFNYTNGAWFKQHPIPSSESGYGIFTLVDDENRERILKICEESSAAKGSAGSNTQLIGDFFSAGMDSMGAEKLGVAAIDNLLDPINKITTKQDVINKIAILQKNGISAGYSISIYADLKNSNNNLLYINQGGLGLPDRDYYFNTDAQTASIRSAYPQHIATMFTLAGKNEADAKLAATKVLALEMFLAKNSRKLEALRDPEKNYNKVKVSNFTIKNIDLVSHFNSLGIQVDSACIGQPEFMIALGNALDAFSIADWQQYLQWCVINNMAPYLQHSLVTENFNFYNAKLNGVKEQKARWKNVLEAQENVLGDALGQLYVKDYCSPKVKARYTDMTNKVMESFAEHIQKLDWMSAPTKQKAIVKLNAITKKVAYPDKWKNYAGMNISRTNYAQNVLNANAWHFADNVSKLNKPVDKTEWDMMPQTYNAYYNPSNNEIVLPAAMFIAPGYADNELDDAIMFGYVGASTIGHELTHGFDDEGRKYDEKGNLSNWWTAEDEKKFMEKANKLIKQFNEYTVLENKHPNGAATLGENIADLGGVVIGFDAFKKTKQYAENKLIGGLTPSQRYFMGYAYGWMQVRTKEKLAAQLLSDVHAPIFLRVNGPMSNCDNWYQAFNVQKGTPMYRDSISRVRIW